MYYITTAEGGFGKFLAGFFAVSISFALGFAGCMVQSTPSLHLPETAFWRALLDVRRGGGDLLRLHLPGRCAARHNCRDGKVVPI